MVKLKWEHGQVGTEGAEPVIALGHMGVGRGRTWILRMSHVPLFTSHSFSLIKEWIRGPFLSLLLNMPCVHTPIVTPYHMLSFHMYFAQT